MEGEWVRFDDDDEMQSTPGWQRWNQFNKDTLYYWEETENVVGFM